MAVSIRKTSGYFELPGYGESIKRREEDPEVQRIAWQIDHPNEPNNPYQKLNEVYLIFREVSSRKNSQNLANHIVSLALKELGRGSGFEDLFDATGRVTSAVLKCPLPSATALFLRFDISEKLSAFEDNIIRKDSSTPHVSPEEERELSLFEGKGETEEGSSTPQVSPEQEAAFFFAGCPPVNEEPVPETEKISGCFEIPSYFERVKRREEDPEVRRIALVLEGSNDPREDLYPGLHKAYMLFSLSAENTPELVNDEDARKLAKCIVSSALKNVVRRLNFENLFNATERLTCALLKCPLHPDITKILRCAVSEELSLFKDTIIKLEPLLVKKDRK